jgi:hypothetical protein
VKAPEDLRRVARARGGASSGWPSRSSGAASGSLPGAGSRATLPAVLAEVEHEAFYATAVPVMRLSRVAGDAVGREAESLPLPGVQRSIGVRWDD